MRQLRKGFKGQWRSKTPSSGAAWAGHCLYIHTVRYAIARRAITAIAIVTVVTVVTAVYAPEASLEQLAK
jgi:hypothetical protein